MSVQRIGAWSMRAGLLDPRPWAKVAAGLGLTDVSLSAAAQTHSDAFEPFLSPRKAAEAARPYLDAGIAVHVMLWPRPTVVHAGQLCRYVGDLYAALPELASVDLDAEEQWTRAPTLRVEGEAAAARIRAHWPEGLPLAVNAITAALPKVQPLVDVADVLWPQAYTSTRPGQTSSPGKRQHAVYAAWSAAATRGQKIGMGLAAYSQDGASGLSGPEAMRRAFDAAAQHVTEIRYWSLQELSGGQDAAFVRQRCAALRSS